MRDRELEERIAKLKEIIGLWNRFNQVTAPVLKGAEAGDDLESEFLELKSSIARKYQSLADRFPKRTFPDEEVNAVLSQALSLGHLKGFTEFAASEFQNQWHKVYISLNRQLGHLESERDELRKISGLGVLIRRFTGGKLFKLIIIILIAAGVIVAGQKLGFIGVAEKDELPESAENAEKRTITDYLYEFIDRFRRRNPGGEQE